MNVACLKRDVLSGGSIGREEALGLFSAFPGRGDAICEAANEIRERFCGSVFDLCTIVNGKSGACSEDCKYCAQSSRFATTTEEYPLLPQAEILRDVRKHAGRGIPRYSVVTSGRALPRAELAMLCDTYRQIGAAGGIALCASHGLLSRDTLALLRDAGVERYHCNLETSRRYFPQICTTHTYDEKIGTIRAAMDVGLSVCSGCIVGMGEGPEDRVDLALDLRRLGVKSVPVNVLNPIPGTPFAALVPIAPEEVRATIAVLRFLLPDAAIRLAGGRGLLPDRGRILFAAGANAAITGDMLTTSGVTVEEDFEMAASLGFTVGAL